MPETKRRFPSFRRASASRAAIIDSIFAHGPLLVHSRMLLGVLGRYYMRGLFLAGFLALAAPALADTTFSSGSMLYSAVVTVTTICRIYNSGSKPVTITSVGMV